MKAINIPIYTRGQRACNSNSMILPLELVSTDELRRLNNGEIYGKIDEFASKILKTLREQAEITLQLYSPSPCITKVARASREPKNQVSCPSLHVIIYGPSDLFEAVRDFATECGIFLQDPLYCDRNVRYRNPHLLSGLKEEPIMTNSLCPKDDISLQVEQISPCSDIFSLLSCDKGLPETPTPMAVETELRP